MPRVKKSVPIDIPSDQPAPQPQPQPEPVKNNLVRKTVSVREEQPRSAPILLLDVAVVKPVHTQLGQLQNSHT